MNNEFVNEFPWLQTSYLQLSSYINQNRIPQALLITGNQGLGKQELASNFSQALLCSAQPSAGSYCGKCQSCTLFKAETHPDYFNIEPEESGKEIGIGVIRQLIARLALKPQLESHRVVVINPADNLNKNSSNAFLKYLEEPTERTSLILISAKPSKLLATIRSRCQKISLSVPDENVVKKWCIQKGIENNELLLNLAQGAPLLAKQFADSGLVKLRAEYFTRFINITQSEPNFLVLAEQWNKLDNAHMDLLLFWIISWVSDMVKLTYCNPSSNIYNQDLAHDLQEIALKLNLKDVYKYYDFLLLSRQRLDTQLNKQLMLEEILMQWLKLRGR